MNYEIVELDEFTGSRATLYSIILEGDNITLFDHFLNENKKDYRKELTTIVNQLEVIGKQTGAREKFFRINEGKPGDGVCALYDDPDYKLRLYCIRYGNVAVILGGGGFKGVTAWEDDQKLSQEVKIMMEISKNIMQRLNDGDLKWSSDGLQLLGNLIFTENED